MDYLCEMDKEYLLHLADVINHMRFNNNSHELIDKFEEIENLAIEHFPDNAGLLFYLSSIRSDELFKLKTNINKSGEGKLFTELQNEIYSKINEAFIEI